MRRDDRISDSRSTTPAGGLGPILALAAGMLVAGLPHAAAAYVGPGAGISMLGALWAVIVAIVLALGGLLIWPIRMMMRRRKRSAAVKAAAGDADGAGGA
jgi:hypothetical protein